MQLIVVFEKNEVTGAYFVAGVADTKGRANKLAAMSLAKGRDYTAYTETYNFSGSLNRDCYVVYVKDNWTDTGSGSIGRAFGAMYYKGDQPSSEDVKIYKAEDSARKKMSTIVEDIVDPKYAHIKSCRGACVHIRLNEAVD